MYTKRTFSPLQLLNWTRRETAALVVIAAIPIVLFDVFEQTWIYLPWLPIALIGTAVAFMLSFQNNAAYDRLWEARKIWGSIVNSSRAWAFMVNDFVTNHFAGEHADEGELRSIRKRMIMRHIAWLTALRHELRKTRPWEAVDREKTNREWRSRIKVREHEFTLEEEIEGYMTEADCKRVCGKANSPAHVLALQSRELRDLHARGLVDDFRHMEMQSVLNALVDAQGKSERIKNFPYPRQYATLNAGFLWIFIALIPIGLVREFDRIGHSVEATFPTIGESFVWLSLPLSVIVMWIFHTMERIGRMTENPFEGSVNDVPITTIARGIEIDLREMIDDDPAGIPAPLLANHATQT